MVSELAALAAAVTILPTSLAERFGAEAGGGGGDEVAGASVPPQAVRMAASAGAESSVSVVRRGANFDRILTDSFDFVSYRLQALKAPAAHSRQRIMNCLSRHAARRFVSISVWPRAESSLARRGAR